MKKLGLFGYLYSLPRLSAWRHRHLRKESIWTWAVIGLIAIAMTARATGTTTARVTGTGIGTAIVEAAGTAADSIAPTLRDLRRLTGARMVGLCKTVSANRTGATNTKVRWVA
jgi:hypothetical protein